MAGRVMQNVNITDWQLILTAITKANVKHRFVSSSFWQCIVLKLDANILLKLLSPGNLCV